MRRYGDFEADAELNEEIAGPSALFLEIVGVEWFEG